MMSALSIMVPTGHFSLTHWPWPVRRSHNRNRNHGQTNTNTQNTPYQLRNDAAIPRAREHKNSLQKQKARLNQ
jgi:hypothetical protein